jgi:hypothetical protein
VSAELHAFQLLLSWLPCHLPEQCLAQRPMSPPMRKGMPKIVPSELDHLHIWHRFPKTHFALISRRAINLSCQESFLMQVLDEVRHLSVDSLKEFAKMRQRAGTTCIFVSQIEQPRLLLPIIEKLARF